MLKSKRPLNIIKDLTGLNDYTLNNICKANGLNLPKITEKNDTVYKSLQMLKAGKPNSYILLKLGISRQRLHQIKTKATKYKII